MHARARGPLCAILLASSLAQAFPIPKQTGWVTDTAGVLSTDEVADLNARLGRYERETGNQIFVLVTKSLQGEPIEDVGYQLIQGWRPGQKGRDNGVVLVIALDERRIRIETGKGVGGDLTDLQSNDIIRRRIGPLMREGRVHDAIEAGTDAIRQALSGTTASGTRATRPRQDWENAPVALPRWFDVCFWGFLVFVVLMLVLRSSRRGGRRRGFWGGPFIGGGGLGGWGGGGGGGWGGGDGGGGGFSGGGGGEGGGGGSSDSY